MTPDDFLRTAEELLDMDPVDERHCRAAIHAAYYGVYHAVTAVLNTPEARHCEVVDKLRHLSDPNKSPIIAWKAKRSFEKLRALRVKADYKLDSLCCVEDMEDAVIYAQKVLR